MILGAVLRDTSSTVLEVLCVVPEIGVTLTLSDAEVNVIELDVLETTGGLWTALVVYELVESIDSAEDEPEFAVTEEEFVGSAVDDMENAEVLVCMSENEGKTDAPELPLPDIAGRVGNEFGKEDILKVEAKVETGSPTTVITRHPALQVASSVWFCVFKTLPMTLAQAVIVEVL